MLKQMQREHVHAKLEKRVRDLEKQMRPTSSVVISKDTLVSFRFYRKSTDMSTKDLLGRYKRLFTFIGHEDAANALVSATRLKDAQGNEYKNALTKLRFNDEDMAATWLTQKT